MRTAAASIMMVVWFSLAAQEIATEDLAAVWRSQEILSDFSINGASLDASRQVLSLRMTIPKGTAITEAQVGEMSRLATIFGGQKRFPFKHLVILARYPGETSWRDIRSFLPQLPPAPQKPYESASVPKNSRVGFPRGAPTGSGGALAGKTVYLSAGHGWYYTGSAWTTQRSNTINLVEDFSNAEIVSYYLAPLLRNAGALVLTVRETDRNLSSVTVDDTDDGYEESAGWWESSGSGWGRLMVPLVTGQNPFEAGHYRATTPAAGRWARWTPNIPVAGRYTVYVSFRALSDRAPAARYEVRHAGGMTTVTVDQRHHGNTWFPLGEFPFNAGLDPDSGSVTLIADPSIGGSYVIADAVRFGGGAGVIDRGGGVSGRPHGEEAARYHTQLLGAPTTIYDTSTGDNSDDVTTRSRWAAWENEVGWDDSVFISWHSNAYNGNARGTSTYVYGPNDPGTGWEPAAQAGSEELATLLHNGVVAALREGWDPAWPVSGIGLYSAWFGELNPSYNNEMPACLIELAFHDNTTDSNALRDPRFRAIATRAATHAVIQYFANRDGTSTVYPPDVPRGVRAITVGKGSVRLSWEAPLATPRSLHGDAATGYLVQQSADGYAFDEGVTVSGTTVLFDNLSADQTTYFRVVAVNAGGRSFPSPVVAVRPKNSVAQVLIVDGFTRLDRNQLPSEDLAAYGLGSVVRMRLERMNAYDYVVAHAAALAALGFPFDTVQKTGLGAVTLEAYDAVVWFAGEQSTADESFTAAEQAQVCAYLESGGILFLSGSEYGWDLFEKGSVADRTFFTDCLGLSYLGDDAETYQAATAAGGAAVFDGTLVFDDGTFVYDANYPDLIEAPAGLTFLRYGDGTSGGAGAVMTIPHKVAALGFPFETIVDSETRKALLAGIFGWFGLEPFEETPDEEPSEEDALPDFDETSDDEVSTEGDDSVEEEDTILSPDEESDSGAFPDESADEELVTDDGAASEEEIVLDDQVIDRDETPDIIDTLIVGDEGEIENDGEVSDEPPSDEMSPADEDSAKGSHGGCGCSLI